MQIETREELVSLLNQAAELEHGLCCSYLFASFSCKQRDDEGLSEEQLEAVTRWATAVKEVAEQEMLHLALVSNLLTALGAAPLLRRPDFPQVSPYYPAGITISLRRLDDVSLTRFIYLERPEGMEVEDAVASDPAIELEAETPDAAPGVLQTPQEEAAAPTADAVSYTTVGHLYQAIEDGFERLVDQRGEGDVFIGAPGSQATERYFRFPDLVAVTDLASARQALGVLVEQGEGVRGDWTEAHYGTFLDIREELRAHAERDPNFEPARPVLTDPRAGQFEDDGDRVVDDPMSTSVMELFDNAYELMTGMLLRFFAQTDESNEQLEVLVQTAILLMAEVIDPLGKVLTGMPAGSSHPDSTAGPSFAFHGSVTLLPHRRAAWLIFHERIVELGDYAKRLAEQYAPDAVGQVGDALVDAAAALEPHLDRSPLLPS